MKLWQLSRLRVPGEPHPYCYSELEMKTTCEWISLVKQTSESDTLMTVRYYGYLCTSDAETFKERFI